MGCITIRAWTEMRGMLKCLNSEGFEDSSRQSRSCLTTPRWYYKQHKRLELCCWIHEVFLEKSVRKCVCNSGEHWEQHPLSPSVLVAVICAEAFEEISRIWDAEVIVLVISPR